MVEERFQQQRRHRSFEKDSQSAFYQQQELFKQLEQAVIKNTENKQPESTIVNITLEEKATCKKDTSR